MQSVRVAITMKDPNVDNKIVKNKIRANFWKNDMTVKSITTADKIVVIAVAKILGPIYIDQKQKELM